MPPTLGSNAFSNVHPNFCAWVPYEELATYQSSSWNSRCLNSCPGEYIGQEGIFINVSWSFCDGVLTIFGTGEMGAPSWQNYYRDQITSVIIESGVTNIYNNAFRQHSNLTSVTIPSSVTTIGNGAFLRCSNLTSFTIPNSVTSLGNYAFEGCTSLNSVTIGNGITSIGVSTFSECSSLTSVVIGSNVTSIGGESFYNCTSLTSITIPNSVWSIEMSAFQGCTSLTSVVFGSGVTSIGNGAFYNCTSLISATFLRTTPPSSNFAVFNNVHPNFCLTVPEGSETAYISNPNYKVLCINGNSICQGGGAGTNVSWQLCSGVLTISGTGAMTDFSSNSGAPWYSYRRSITSVVIESGITTIGDNAFYGCSNLTEVTIPASVTSIGNSTFQNCSSLTSATVLNPTPPALGSNAFSGAHPSFCVWVPSGSLAGYVADSEWRSHCLNGCRQGSAGTNISWHLCYDEGVLTISGSGAMTNYGSGGAPWYNWRSSITSVVVESGVTSIGDYAFQGCTNLTEVTISVTSVGQSAFSDCTGLTDVTIGNIVTTIGDYAFQGCTNISTIISHRAAPPTVYANTLTSIPSSCCLYVPSGSVASYQLIQHWNRFASCVQIAVLYTVTFNSQGGSAVPSKSVQQGTKAKVPTPAPTREGFTFGGWYKESSCINAWNFSADVVTANTTLYAKWTIASGYFQVTFNSQGGSAVPTQSVAYNSTATVPTPAPTRNGYDFVGWYAESAGFAWDFNTSITCDTTLYARWGGAGNIRACEGRDFTISVPFRSSEYTVTYRWYRAGVRFGSEVTLPPTANPKIISPAIPAIEAIGVNVLFYFEYALNDDCPTCWTRSPDYLVNFISADFMQE